jgi:hypothetical protein
MKQSEIDRWMRRQARRDSHRTIPGVNWALIIAMLMIGVACLYLLLKLTHMG